MFAVKNQNSTKGKQFAVKSSGGTKQFAVKSSNSNAPPQRMVINNQSVTQQKSQLEK